MWVGARTRNSYSAYYFNRDYIKDHPEIFEGTVLFDIATGFSNGKYKQGKYANEYDLVNIDDDNLDSILPIIFVWHKYAPVPLVNAHLPDEISELRKLRKSLIFYGFKIPAEIVERKINKILLGRTFNGIVFSITLTGTYFLLRKMINYLTIF